MLLRTFQSYGQHPMYRVCRLIVSLEAHLLLHRLSKLSSPALLVPVCT